MFELQKYSGMTHEEIEKAIQKAGFDPLLISNGPGFVYSSHHHPQTKLLAFVKGEMEVEVNGEQFYCRSGDQIIIPGNTPHSAVVGPHGCTFFWSEK